MGNTKKRHASAQQDKIAKPSSLTASASIATTLPTAPLLSDLKNQRIILPIATFIIAMTGYILTFARTVTLVDSGELILTSAGLGVAHPPGTPLYTMLGHLFTLLPFGSVAARISFMSAIFAALAATFLTLIVVEVNDALIIKKRVVGKSSGKNLESLDAETGGAAWSRVFNWLMPVAIGLTFAFSVTLWFYASVAEVYSLNIMLLTAIVYLMLRWQRLHRRGEISQCDWLIPLAAMVYGLALGVHHVTILLTLPAIALLVLRTAGIKYFLTRPVGLAFITVLIGFSVYLYLPWAAARAPVLNWGNPSNWQRFYWHISAKQYQVNLFSASADDIAQQIKYFFDLIFWQFTPIGFIGGLIGMWALWRRERSIFWLLALIIAFDVAYSVIYQIAEDKDAYYLTAEMALAIAIGAGAKQFLDWVKAQGKPAIIGVLSLFAILPMANFKAHYFENNKSHYYIARDFVENTLSAVQPNGLLLTMEWQFYSPYLYLRHIENYRRDATVVDVNLLRRSWYIEGYLKREYPEMMQACANETKDFLEDLSLFEHDQPYDAARINKRFVALINAFIKFKMQSNAAYTMLPMEPGVGAEYTWVPQGLALRMYPDQTFHPEPLPQMQLRGLLDGSVFLDEVAKGKLLRIYATMTANRGKYLAAGKQYDQALDYLQQALQFDNGFDRIYEFFGDVYAAQGRSADAARAYQEALQLNPNNQAAQQHLQALHAGP